MTESRYIILPSLVVAEHRGPMPVTFCAPRASERSFRILIAVAIAVTLTVIPTGTLGAGHVDAPPNETPSTATMSVELLEGETRRDLILAIAKWRGEDFTAAGIDLARLINSASSGQREAMSDFTRRLTRLSLAELAADAHYRAAFASQRGPAVRFRYVTEFEKPVLIPRIAAAYEAIIHEKEQSAKETAHNTAWPPTPESRRPATQPWYAVYPLASQPTSAPAEEAEPEPEADFAVVDWLDRPATFEGSPSQVERLLPRVHHALSLMNERVRLDTDARRDASLRRQLLDERHRLQQLAGVLRDYEEPRPAAQPTPLEQAHREEMKEQREKLSEEQRKRLEDMRAKAREWQRAQEAKRRPSGFPLFDWLIPREEKLPPPRLTPDASTPQ